MTTSSEAKVQPEVQAKQEQPPKAEERPPQQQELLCTICGLRSCWR